MTFKRIIFLSLLTFSLVNVYCQEWENGSLTLKDGTNIKGEFSLQSFGTYEVVRHNKEVGQNTFPTEAIDKLILWTSKDTTKYRCLNFNQDELRTSPRILFEVLYESDSFKLFRNDIKSLEKYFRVYPIPGLVTIFKWGSEVRNRDVLLMCKNDVNDLIIINKLKKNQDYDQLIIDKDVVSENFFVSHKPEMEKFFKDNKIKWRRLSDFIKSIKHYDQVD